MKQVERRLLQAEGRENVKSWSQAGGTCGMTTHLGGPWRLGRYSGRGEAGEDRRLGSGSQRGSKVMF